MTAKVILVREAISRREPQTELYRFVTTQDAGGDVDEFYERFKGRPLTRDDIHGIARNVVEWCEQNELNVFIMSERVPLNEDEYILVAEPA